MEDAGDCKRQGNKQISPDQAALFQMPRGICDEVGDATAAPTNELVIEAASLTNVSVGGHYESCAQRAFDAELPMHRGSLTPKIDEENRSRQQIQTQEAMR